MLKKVKVKSYLRKGKAVKSHNRFLDNKNNLGPNSNAKKTNPSDSLMFSRGSYETLLKKENFEGIVFEDLKIDGADLAHIKTINNCEFKNCIIKNVDFRKTKITNSSFENVKVLESAFDEVTIDNCYFHKFWFMSEKKDKNVSWRNVETTNSVFVKFCLHKTKMDDSKFENCLMQRHESTVVFFNNCKFTNVDMSKGILRNVDFNGSIFEDSDISHCQIRAYKRDKSSPFSMRNCDLSSTKFDSGMLHESEFIRCNVSEMEIVGANAKRISFEGSSGSRISFRESHGKHLWVGSIGMEGCDFSGANLTDVHLHGVDIRGAKWDDSSVTVSSHPLMGTVKYDRYSLHEALKQSGLTEKQFEFLVLSKAIEVRNFRGEIVEENFDLQEHHIPAWTYNQLQTIRNDFNLGGQEGEREE